MAFSMSCSTTKAQIPLNCYLCEENPNIQWKCLDCNMLICSKCKTKVHSKFKSSDEHHIISLKDIEIEQEVKPNLQNIPCKTHLGQKVCLYCKNCNKLACPNCVFEAHNKHDLDSLSNIFQTKYDKLKYIREELEVDLGFFVQECTEIETQQSTEKYQLEKTKGRILNQAENIKRAVDEECARTLENLDINYAGTASDIEAHKKVNIDIQQDIKNAISFLDSTLNRKDIEAMINVEQNSLALMTHKEKYVQREYRSAVEFKSGNVNKSQLSSTIGSLQKEEGTKLQFEVSNSNKGKIGIVANLYACLDGFIIMADNQFAQSIKKIRMKDGRLKTIKETKKLSVFDITETERNKFVISFTDSTCLKLWHEDGTLKHFLELSPLLPRALHYTKSGKLLLSVREQGDPYPVTPESKRKLLVMEPNGNQIHEYHCDEQNKPLFSMVGRITTGKNNIIYLIDWISNISEGYVAALAYPNKVTWRYTGHSSVNIDTSKSFRPCGIASTGSGNIVVCDFGAHALHILNTMGTLKCSIDTTSYGIAYPCSLAINATGEMWIGCSKVRNEDTDNAMLYIVKFSGF